MSFTDPRNRLQPALLDRLMDDARSPDADRARRHRAGPGPGDWRPRDDRARRAIRDDPAAAVATGATPLDPPVRPAPVHDTDRAMTSSQLRQAVLRDLGALFNAVRPIDAATAAAHPRIAGTVLDFGLPPLAGQLASKLDVPALERVLRQTIRHFEPRLLPGTLHVRALEATSLLDTHNVVEFEITGHLWSEPVPLEILLRTQIDLEAGQVRVRDASTGVASHTDRPPRGKGFS